MRIIFEEDIEHEDFLELILTPEELYMLPERGLIRNYPRGLRDKRNLNVFLRIENQEERDYATSERQEQENSVKEYTHRNSSRKAAKASRSHSAKHCA